MDWSKFWLDKSDWHFIRYTILLTIILGAIIIYFTPSLQMDVSFYLSLVGGFITISALAFTMYQQFKLRTITARLSQNKKEMNKAVRNGFYQYSFNKALWLCDKIEDEDPNDNSKVVQVLLKELKTILLDCRKANLIHYKRLIEEKLEDLKEKSDISKNDIELLIKCCKDECKAEWENDFSQYILRLTGEYQLLSDKADGKNVKVNRAKFNSIIFEVSDYINQIKPDYVSNIDI